MQLSATEQAEITALEARVAELKATATYAYEKHMLSKAATALSDARQYHGTEHFIAKAKRYIERVAV